MRLPARIILGFLLFISTLFVFPPLAFAQISSTSSIQLNTTSDVPPTTHTLAQGVFLDVLSAISCQLSGIDPLTANHQCLGYNTQTGKLSYAPTGGVFSFLTSTMVMFYNPPVHTATYASYLAQNFGLVKNTYAAGNTGFDQLSPLTHIWIGFRNLVYLLYVLAFVAIGMAIMLRVKMDPRTVMTIENQLPKILVSLILVTFSFAIAGLVVDFMWILSYLIINLFSSLDPTGFQAGNVANGIRTNLFFFPNTFANANASGIGVFQIAKDTATSISVIINNTLSSVLLDTSYGSASGWLAFFYFPGSVPCLPQLVQVHPGIIPIGFDGTQFINCARGNLISQVSFVGSLVAFLFILVALVIALFKVWITLLYAYVLFLMFAASGPLFIVAGIVPGSKINFEYWLRQMIAYMMSFVTVLAILLFGKVLMDAFGNSSVGLVPPFLGIQSATASKSLAALIGFAVMLLVPQALQMTRDLVGAPPIKYLPGIGQGLAAGASVTTGFLGKNLWDPFFRHHNWQTGQQEGILRHLFLPEGEGHGLIPGPIRRWMGYGGSSNRAQGYTPPSH